MATIVLRSVKGSPLLNDEVDDNFNNINTEKVERDGSIPFTGDITLNKAAPAINLNNGETLTLGDATNPIAAPGGFVGDVTGNSDTATTLETVRNIAISGHAIGNANFDGSANIDIVITLEDNSVTNSKIGADAVNGDKIADSSIGSEHLNGAIIGTSNIQTDAITGNEIAGGAVGNAQLAADAVTTVKILNDAVTTVKILNDAVTTVKILNDAVTFAKIQNISTMTLLGRTSAGTGDTEQISILDEDNMASDSDTSIPTQQSVKAYVDANVGGAPLNVNDQTGTSYTLVLSDEIVTMNNAAANTLTVPTNASVAFPIGTIIGVTMKGAGITSIVADSGVNINGSTQSFDISAQWGQASLTKIGTNDWTIAGSLV